MKMINITVIIMVYTRVPVAKRRGRCTLLNTHNNDLSPMKEDDTRMTTYNVLHSQLRFMSRKQKVSFAPTKKRIAGSKKIVRVMSSIHADETF